MQKIINHILKIKFSYLNLLNVSTYFNAYTKIINLPNPNDLKILLSKLEVKNKFIIRDTQKKIKR